MKVLYELHPAPNVTIRVVDESPAWDALWDDFRAYIIKEILEGAEQSAAEPERDSAKEQEGPA